MVLRPRVEETVAAVHTIVSLVDTDKRARTELPTRWRDQRLSTTLNRTLRSMWLDRIGVLSFARVDDRSKFGSVISQS